MKGSILSLFLCLTVGGVLSEDIVCSSGTKSTDVVINKGDVFKFSTAGKRYPVNADCSGNYQLGDCPAAEVTCTKFKTAANKKCTKGDIMTVTDDNGTSKFCKKKKPVNKVLSGDFSIRFTSDGKKQSKGMKCTVKCTDDGSGSGTPSGRTYLAGLSYSYSAEELKSPYCAGTLIADRWILTSATCSLSNQQKIGVGKVNVLLGEESLVTQNSPTYKVVSVSGIYYPSTFSVSGSSEEDDIALWKLSESVDTEIYKPLCLPSEGSVASGTSNLVGWRISDIPGSLSEEVVEKPVLLTSAGCSDKQLCGSEEAKCQGDYGGPLVQDSSVIGIVSRSGGCQVKPVSTFTRVSSYLDFIQSTIGQNGGGSVCTD